MRTILLTLLLSATTALAGTIKIEGQVVSISSLRYRQGETHEQRFALKQDGYLLNSTHPYLVRLKSLSLDSSSGSKNERDVWVTKWHPVGALIKLTVTEVDNDSGIAIEGALRKKGNFLIPAATSTTSTIPSTNTTETVICYGKVRRINYSDESLIATTRKNQYDVTEESHPFYITVEGVVEGIVDVVDGQPRVHSMGIHTKQPYKQGTVVRLRATRIKPIGQIGSIRYAEGTVPRIQKSTLMAIKAFNNPAQLARSVQVSDTVIRGTIVSASRSNDQLINAAFDLGYIINNSDFTYAYNVGLDDCKINAYVLSSHPYWQVGSRYTFIGLQSIGAVQVNGKTFPIYLHYLNREKVVESKHKAKYNYPVPVQPDNTPNYTPRVYETEPYVLKSITELAAEDFWDKHERASITLSIKEFLALTYSRKESIPVTMGAYGMFTPVATAEGPVAGLIQATVSRQGSSGSYSSTKDIFGNTLSEHASLPGAHGLVFGFNDEQAARILGTSTVNGMTKGMETKEQALGAIKRAQRAQTVTITFTKSSYAKYDAGKLSGKGGSYDTLGTRDGRLGRVRGTESASLRLGNLHVYQIVVEDFRFNTVSPKRKKIRSQKPPTRKSLGLGD